MEQPPPSPQQHPPSEMNAPRAGITPAHASSAAPPSTEVKHEAIAAASSASSPPGMARKDRMPSAPPFMTGAAAEKLEKKPQMVCMYLGGAVHRCNEEVTPVSTGSSNVGSSSARSRSSPNEKARSPEEVTPSLASYLSELVENLRITWHARDKAEEEKGKEVRMKVKQVQKLARECGANENNPHIWLGSLEILHSECATKFFLRSNPVGRMVIIKHYGRVHACQDLCGSQPRNIQRNSLLKRDKNTAEDSKAEWDEVFNMFVENSAVGFNYGSDLIMERKGERPSTPLPRAPTRPPPPPSEMNAPCAGFAPAHASSAAPPSTKVKHEAIAAAPPASSPPGLTRKDGMPSAPPFMTRAAAEKLEVRKEKTAPTPAVEKCICTVGNEKSCTCLNCLTCLRTTCTTCTAAGISGQKKPQMVRMYLGGVVHRCNEEVTPVSTGSSNVGRSNARSSGSSPNEKARSLEEVTPSMASYMSKLVEKLRIIWDTNQKAQQEKEKEQDMKVTQVEQLARECGANENTPDLWLGVLEILHSECATKFFLRSNPVGRMAIIKHYARVHGCQDLCGSQPRNIRRNSLLKRDKNTAEDSKAEWDEVFNMFVENSAVGFNYGTSSMEEVLGGC